MYLYFGMKYENDRWNIGTAILPRKNEIAECICIQQEMHPESIWIIGCCRKGELESTYQQRTTATIRR